MPQWFFTKFPKTINRVKLSDNRERNRVNSEIQSGSCFSDTNERGRQLRRPYFRCRSADIASYRRCSWSSLAFRNRVRTTPNRPSKWRWPCNATLETMWAEHPESRLRIDIHTGPVVAGVIGEDKFTKACGETM